MKKSQKKSQPGFTLIELVLVLVILGILAAVAVPVYYNLQAQTQKAADESTEGAVQSASVLNFAAKKQNPPSGQDITASTTCIQALQGIMANYNATFTSGGAGGITQPYILDGSAHVTPEAGNVVVGFCMACHSTLETSCSSPYPSDAITLEMLMTGS